MRAYWNGCTCFWNSVSFIRVFFRIRRHVCSPSRLAVHTPFPCQFSSPQPFCEYSHDMELQREQPKTVSLSIGFRGRPPTRHLGAGPWAGQWVQVNPKQSSVETFQTERRNNIRPAEIANKTIKWDILGTSLQGSGKPSSLPVATYNVRITRNVNMAPPPDPTPSCIHCSKNTRDLCSVATYNVRSTRNVNMPPPTPPHHDLRTHARNVRFTSTVFGPLEKNKHQWKSYEIFGFSFTSPFKSFFLGPLLSSSSPHSWQLFYSKPQRLACLSPTPPGWASGPGTATFEDTGWVTISSESTGQSWAFPLWLK